MANKPSPWGGSEANKVEKCISAGAWLARENESFKNATPVIYQSNLLLKPEAFLIPHSELAMHVGAAGKEIIAFFTTTGAAYVVYSDEDGCGYTSGTINELLTRELWEQVQQKWPGR